MINRLIPIAASSICRGGLTIGLVLAASVGVVYAQDAQNEQGEQGECGVDRLCTTPAVEAVMAAAQVHERKAQQLRWDLELQRYRTQIAQEEQQAEAARAENDTAGSSPAATRPPMPPPAPGSQVDMNFPQTAGPPPAAPGPRFPFPDSGNAPGNADSGSAFAVQGVTDDRAIVAIDGSTRIVRVGDELGAGTVASIQFDGVEVDVNGTTTLHTVQW